VKFIMIFRIVWGAAPMLALMGCDAHPPTRPTAEQLATLTPSNRRLAELYEHSCKACHAKPESGAPLVHDWAAWDSLWSKGLPTLVDHAVVGFQGMPAGGQCATCEWQDYENLIRFMANREASK